VLIYLTKKDCELFDMDQFSTLTEQEFTTFAMTHPAGNFLETKLVMLSTLTAEF